MNFFTQLCPDSTPNLLNFFSTTVAPKLLFYSYLPIMALALFFGFYVYVKDKHSLQSRLFLFVSMAFFSWIVVILFQWIAVYVNVVHFAWQILVIPEILIYVFSFHFVYVFLNKKDLPYWAKIILSFFTISVFVLMPTEFNVSSFDLINCQGNLGYLWHYIYALESSLVVIIGFLCVHKYIFSNSRDERGQAVLLFLGMLSFLGFFFATNLYGEILNSYSINLYGPIGMAIFIGLLSYMIIRFKTFHAQLIGAQALVVSLAILIGASLLVKDPFYSVLIMVITLLLVIVLGYFLVRSVKREVSLRESLQIANEGQENLIHVMNHQIKGYLSKARNIFSELDTNPHYGPVSESAKPIIHEGFKSLTDGVQFVQSILMGSSAQSGAIVYNMQPFDFKTIVVETVDKEKAKAGEKGLKLNLNITDNSYEVNGDAMQLKEAVRNLIDNSIIYTQCGEVDASLDVKGDKVVFIVRDTGIGISTEDKQRLFTKGGRGRDSMKVNVNSSGYGLAFVKAVVEAHKGRVWAESAGPGQGSQFYMELPLK